MDKIEQMRIMCKSRPVIYSDLDHLKKGSTKFLHEKGCSHEDMADALDLELREVKSNLSGTGFDLDYRKISRFEDQLPEKIGDIIKIRIPDIRDANSCTPADVRVIQCIPRFDSCGLLVELLEDIESNYPLLSCAKKGDEIVIPLKWYVRD